MEAAFDFCDIRTLIEVAHVCARVRESARVARFVRILHEALNGGAATAYLADFVECDEMIIGGASFHNTALNWLFARIIAHALMQDEDALAAWACANAEIARDDDDLGIAHEARYEWVYSVISGKDRELREVIADGPNTGLVSLVCAIVASGRAKRVHYHFVDEVITNPRIAHHDPMISSHNMCHVGRRCDPLRASEWIECSLMCNVARACELVPLREDTTRAIFADATLAQNFRQIFWHPLMPIGPKFAAQLLRDQCGIYDVLTACAHDTPEFDMAIARVGEKLAHISDTRSRRRGARLTCNPLPRMFDEVIHAVLMNPDDTAWARVLDMYRSAESLSRVYSFLWSPQRGFASFARAIHRLESAGCDADVTHLFCIPYTDIGYLAPDEMVQFLEMTCARMSREDLKNEVFIPRAYYHSLVQVYGEPVARVIRAYLGDAPKIRM